MIQVLTQHVFYLTPYIFFWSFLNGTIALGVLKLLNNPISRKNQVATALTTAIASILWNWSIEFNQSTIYLNVDHPIFRISWADAFNGIGVFAFVSLVLGFWVNPGHSAITIARIAGIAAIVTIVTDTFFF
jgi:hypothetical protein